MDYSDLAASGGAASSSADAPDDYDLYGGMDIAAQQLPSSVELQSSLEEAVARRTNLQAELQSLQEQFASGKQRVEDLTRRVCVLLKTAQLEISRKAAQLEARQQAPEPPQPEAQRHQPADGKAPEPPRRLRSPDRRPRRSRSPERRQRRSRSPDRDRRRRQGFRSRSHSRSRSRSPPPSRRGDDRGRARR